MSDIQLGLYTAKYDSSCKREQVKVIEISHKSGVLRYRPQDDVSAYTCDIDWFLERYRKIEIVEIPSEQGRKDDSSKRRYSLLPKGAVNSVVDVLEFGSKKYADNNWQKVPGAKTRYYDAAMRHLDAWLNGDLKDAETGLPHLAHAICCLMFLMWFDSE